MKFLGKFARIRKDHIARQKNICHMFSPTCGSKIQLFTCKHISWSSYRTGQVKEHEGVIERDRVISGGMEKLRSLIRRAEEDK